MNRKIDKTDEKLLVLKAALWEEGDTQQLLSKAIRKYQDKIDFPKADSNIFIGGKEITVEGVPHIIRNNQLHENFILMAALEDVIETKYANNLPTKIQFCSLLN